MQWWWSSGSKDPLNSSAMETPDSSPESLSANPSSPPKSSPATPSSAPDAEPRPELREQARAAYREAMRKTETDLSEFMPVFSDPQPTGSHSVAHPDDPPLAPFPRHMSCRDAFDAAFYCQSLGGQFNSVYRYGTMRSCSEHWAQFWFCMRTRGRNAERKAELIEDFYRKKNERLVSGPSSNDVWEERTERVQRAFDWDPDEAGILEKSPK
ncbi:hypothetical protein EJ06DRAFT_532159 [Trichodelitschia bisporula]|uniref:Early meiotic induction protein 1 n=1 Tax=Trichodelitschia bisporula TaxID=703511 RepID=A0A6G1HRD6_9PEZI|nr:hypothetical protein EJ06DRAFT_532159 [Trichodelitschia bisporula]